MQPQIEENAITKWKSPTLGTQFLAPCGPRPLSLGTPIVIGHDSRIHFPHYSFATSQGYLDLLIVTCTCALFHSLDVSNSFFTHPTQTGIYCYRVK